MRRGENLEDAGRARGVRAVVEGQRDLALGQPAVAEDLVAGDVDGVSAANVTASYTDVTLGPGNVNFMPSGTGVTVTNNISGTSTPNPCTDKWVTF